MKNTIYITLLFVLIALAGPTTQKTSDKSDTLDSKSKGASLRQTTAMESAAPAPAVAGASESADETSFDSREAESVSESKPSARAAEPAKDGSAKSKNDIVGSIFKAIKESIEEENSDYDVFQDENKNGIDDKLEKKSKSKSTSSTKSQPASSESKVKTSKPRSK